MTVQRGSTGIEVTQLQQRLQTLGWELKADGQFGLYTDAAVRKQQRTMGLVPDGIVGPVTSEALTRESPRPSNLFQPLDQPRPLVAYRTQRDNAHDASSTCNVTSYATAMSQLGVKGRHPEKQLEDELYELIVSPAGQAELKRSFGWAVGKVAPQTVHGMLVWAAAQYGVTSHFRMDARWIEIVQELRQGRPVVISGWFTASGHVVCAVNAAGSSDLIVHDPWGDWNRGYRERDGSARIYTREALLPICRGDGQMWAHFFS